MQAIVQSKSATAIAKRASEQASKQRTTEYDDGMQDAILRAKQQALELRKKLVSGSVIEAVDFEAAAPTGRHADWAARLSAEHRGDGDAAGGNAGGTWRTLLDGGDGGQQQQQQLPMMDGRPDIPRGPAVMPAMLTHREEPR